MIGSIFEPASGRRNVMPGKDDSYEQFYLEGTLAADCRKEKL